MPSVHDNCSGTDVKITHGDRAFFRRKPLGTSFQARRDHRSFRRTYRPRATPMSRQRSGTAEYGSCDSEESVANFCSQNI